MVKLITISKDGKITLPRDVRKEIGLKGEEQYVLVMDAGDIILKRIERDRSRQRIKELLNEFHAAFKKHKTTKRDVEEAIRGAKTAKNND